MDRPNAGVESVGCVLIPVIASASLLRIRSRTVVLHSGEVSVPRIDRDERRPVAEFRKTYLAFVQLVQVSGSLCRNTYPNVAACEIVPEELRANRETRACN